MIRERSLRGENTCRVRTALYQIPWYTSVFLPIDLCLRAGGPAPKIAAAAAGVESSFRTLLSKIEAHSNFEDSKLFRFFKENVPGSGDTIRCGISDVGVVNVQKLLVLLFGGVGVIVGGVCCFAVGVVFVKGGVVGVFVVAVVGFVFLLLAACPAKHF